jgi:hypothetical protein
MMTRLVDVEDARARLESGELAYAFETSDQQTIVGPACKFGPDYLRHLRTEGRYAENIEQADQLAESRGVAITGIWFVRNDLDSKKQPD